MGGKLASMHDPKAYGNMQALLHMSCCNRG